MDCVNGNGLSDNLPPTTQQLLQQAVTSADVGSYTTTASNVAQAGDPIVDIIKGMLPNVTSHAPSTVASESIASFNTFMELSSKQLTDWVDFLCRERRSSISPNNRYVDFRCRERRSSILSDSR